MRKRWWRWPLGIFAVIAIVGVLPSTAYTLATGRMTDESQLFLCGENPPAGSADDETNGQGEYRLRDSPFALECDWTMADGSTMTTVISDPSASPAAATALIPISLGLVAFIVLAISVAIDRQAVTRTPRRKRQPAGR